MEGIIPIFSKLELHQLIKPLILILILIDKLSNLVPCLDLLHDCLFGDAGVLAVYLFFLLFVLHAGQLVDVFVFFERAFALLDVRQHHCLYWVFRISADGGAALTLTVVLLFEVDITRIWVLRRCIIVGIGGRRGRWLGREGHARGREYFAINHVTSLLLRLHMLSF